MVAKAVFSTFLSFVAFPEFISIATRASVGLIIKYPPDFNLTGFQNYHAYNYSPALNVDNFFDSPVSKFSNKQILFRKKKITIQFEEIDNIKI